MGPLCRGPVWMPITPKRGSFLHAESHPVRLELVLIVTLVKVLAFLAVKSLMLGIECRGQRGLRIPAVFVERRRGGLAVCGAAQSFSTADGR